MPADRPAGRATDAEVAEKVIGLVRCQSDHGGHLEDFPYCFARPESPCQGGECPQYSTDWSAMPEVVERMQQRGYYFELVGRPDGSFAARFRRPKTLNAWQLYRNAADAPLATCDAALSALAARPAPEGRE